MSGVEDIKEQERVDGHVPEESEKPTLSSQEEVVFCYLFLDFCTQLIF